ncbi:mechanosensitive ion channel family protein, partial [Flavobacterium sp. 3-210]
MILGTKRLLSFLLLLSAVLITPLRMEAQLLGAAKTTAEEPAKIPDDSLGRRTPQGTVNGFIKA